MIWLLLAACAVSAALGEVADAVALGTILLLNALVGVQELRAERAVLARRAMSAARVLVQRRPHTHPSPNGRPSLLFSP